jgi:choline dehydrogenase-like flavoprotein
MISTGIDGLEGAAPDILVIGAGPVGITLALALQGMGRQVLLLESGAARPSGETQELARAEIPETSRQVSMEIAVSRQLGGTSALWGGRCVAMDPLDFEVRPAIPHSGWPISAADVAPHLEEACRLIGLGPPRFSAPLAGMPETAEGFDFHRLERWSQQPRFHLAHGPALARATAIDVRLQATVTALEHASDGRVSTACVAGPGGTRARLAPRCVVLAAGGVENTRLLLAGEMAAPGRYGGADGPLGRYYMGHLYGVSAEMDITAPWLDAGIDFFRDGGTYARRRFTPRVALQRSLGLANVSFTPDYPRLLDPGHGNGIMSFAYLVLSLPPLGRRIMVESVRRNYVGSGGNYGAHLLNVLRDLPRTAGFLPGFLYHRYLARPRMPGFFQRNAARRYAVRFHAEHLPNPASCITLTGERDALGLPRVRLDLRYSQADAQALIRAHEAFAGWLETTGLGRMRWLVPEEERAAHILAQCYDGHHQIGTTRMAASAVGGVVSGEGRVFGAANLFVAGSSVFPTSGAANPTLTAVALALRLAGLLGREVPRT